MDWQTFLLGWMSAPSLCILAWLLLLYRDVRKMVRVGLTVLASVVLIAATPVEKKRGQCPSGYASGAHYCAPMPGEQRQAVPRRGACPSGSYQSGGYCVEQKRPDLR
jgi:hypothetical protein